MARPSTVLVIFVVALNLITAVLAAQGVFAMLGVAGDISSQQTVTEASTQADSVATGNGVGGTLFGLYNTLAGAVGGVYDVIYPALNTFERAGVPAYITEGILGNLFTLIIFFDIASYIRGFDL